MSRESPRRAEKNERHRVELDPAAMGPRAASRLQSAPVAAAAWSCLIAVSGGADSMVLLHLMATRALKAGWTLEVGHVNHGLRGEASEADEALVRGAAAQLGLPCHARRAAPLAERPGGISPEQFLRTERHRLLNAMAAERGLDAIAFGHNSDDLAETFLLHLLRGAGLDGLAFRARTPGAMARPEFVRPLWKIGRDAIRRYAAAENISFRDDRSNSSLDHARNRLRHVVLPLLAKEFNPRAAEQIAQAGRWLGQVDDELRTQIRKRMSLPVDPSLEEELPTTSLASTRQLPSATINALPEHLLRLALREWVSAASGGRLKIDSRQVEAILATMRPASGTAVIRRRSLAGGWRLACTRTMLLLAESDDELDKAIYRISVGDRGEGRDSLSDRTVVGKFQGPLIRLSPAAEKKLSITGVGMEAVADIETKSGRMRVELRWLAQSAARPLKTPICVRNRRPGDRVPGAGSLKEILIKDGVPAAVREDILVVADAQQTVVCALGLPRIAARAAKALDAQTVETKFEMIPYQ